MSKSSPMLNISNSQNGCIMLGTLGGVMVISIQEMEWKSLQEPLAKWTTRGLVIAEAGINY